MKVLAEISVGELFDKITILNIKTKKIEDKQKLKNILKELNTLNEQATKIDISDKLSLDDQVKKLQFINEELWDIENFKRECEANKDFGENFIKLSRDVHILNDDRAKIKLEINNLTGSKIKEIKEYFNY